MILSISYVRDNCDNNETDDDKEVSIFYLNLKIMKVANVTMLKKIKIELLPNRLVPQVTSSDPEGATIFIQLGTCPDNLVTVNDCTSL